MTIHIDGGYLTCIKKIQDMVTRVEQLEHWVNQQSILLETLGDVMEELKKQELQAIIIRKTSEKDTLGGKCTTMVMPFRRRMSRRSGIRPVIQLFKKVLNIAPASRAGGATIVHPLSLGVDSVAAGQTGPTDTGVPTGSIIKYIEIHYMCTNLVAISHFQSVTIQRIHAGQSVIAPLAVGGDDQRNQVHHQIMFSVGKEQNSIHVFRFKVPGKFQRVRAGDSWQMVVSGSAAYADAVLVIYKFYRQSKRLHQLLCICLESSVVMIPELPESVTDIERLKFYSDILSNLEDQSTIHTNWHTHKQNPAVCWICDIQDFFE